MRIVIFQVGGFAGVAIEVARVDTDRLDPAGAVALLRAVAESGFFARPATVPGTRVGADFLTYEITIEDGARSHRVRFVDDGTPATAALHRLVDEARRLA